MKRAQITKRYIAPVKETGSRLTDAVQVVLNFLTPGHLLLLRNSPCSEDFDNLLENLPDFLALERGQRVLLCE